jgi:MFS family permease
MRESTISSISLYHLPMNNQPPRYQSIADSQQPPVEKWWVMVGISLGILMYTIDTSIVNIALPTLVEKLHTDFATVQWVGLSYVLVVTAFVLGAARLGDMYGKKPLYLGGLIVFTISSLLCGLAPSIQTLIGARALQGVGAVMISALGAAIIAETFPLDRTYTKPDKPELMSTSYFIGGIGAAIPQ